MHQADQDELDEELEILLLFDEEEEFFWEYGSDDIRFMSMRCGGWKSHTDLLVKNVLYEVWSSPIFFSTLFQVARYFSTEKVFSHISLFQTDLVGENES